MNKRWCFIVNVEGKTQNDCLMLARVLSMDLSMRLLDKLILKGSSLPEKEEKQTEHGRYKFTLESGFTGTFEDALDKTIQSKELGNEWLMRIRFVAVEDEQKDCIMAFHKFGAGAMEKILQQMITDLEAKTVEEVSLN